MHTRQTIAQYTLPTVAQIHKHREALFLSKLQEVLASDDVEMHKLVEELMDAGYEVQDIAVAAIRLARSEEKNQPIEEISEFHKRDTRSRDRSSSSKKRRKHTDHGSRPSKNPATRENGMIRFSIGVGKDQGIRPRDIVGAIASEADIPGKAIGAIMIQNELTYVDVAEQHAGRVMRKMQKCWIRGHPVHLNQLD